MSWDFAVLTKLSETAWSHNLRLRRSSRLVCSLHDVHIRLPFDLALRHGGHEASE